MASSTRRRLLASGLALAAGLPAGARAADAQDPSIQGDAPAPIKGGALAPGTVLTVFAAASLTDAMTQVGRLWQAQGHAMPRFSFGSSGTLARQIAEGAPADLFLSADEKWMDWLAGQGALRAGSRRDLVSNRLVLVERRAAMHPVTLQPGAALQPALRQVLGAGGRLAVGDPASVPAGIYAQQALQALGQWEWMKDRLAPAENVRAALLLVQRGEAPAGIVYGSDVRVAPDLAVAGTFPATSHKPIRYPGAVLKQSTVPGPAQAFLSFLAGSTAQAMFHNVGFGSVTPVVSAATPAPAPATAPAASPAPTPAMAPATAAPG